MNELGQKMNQVVEFFQSELAAIRTGRANPALVTELKVDSYGSPVPLKQIAQISTPDATTIVITPWDKGTLPAIESAIATSELGINPNNDGTHIRLALPPMTEERRSELTKVVGEKLEASRVALRNVRHEAISQAEQRDLSEDELKRVKDDATKLTAEHNARLEQLAADKKQEIMTI